jgi:hypothetical protein
MMDMVYGYENIGRVWWGDHAGEPLNEEQQNKAAWYGHFRFGLHRELGKPVQYITIVRDPVERFLSEYVRNRRRIREGKRPAQSAADPSIGSNLMTRMLSGAKSTDTLCPSDVDKALANVNKYFLFVGETEHYDVLFSFLKQELQWPIPLEKPLHENKCRAVDRITLEEIAELRESPHMALDQELYEKLTHVF